MPTSTKKTLETGTLTPRGGDGGELHDQFGKETETPTLEVSLNHTLHEHVPSDEKTGLGRWAVELAVHKAFDTEGAREQYEQHRQSQVKEARAKIENLNPEQRRQFHEIVVEKEVSPFVKQTIGEKVFRPRRFIRSGALAKRLSAKDREGNYKVNDEAFANFLEWHNYNLVKTQKELDEREPDLKQKFADSFKQAIMKGWAPKAALSHLGRLEQTKLVADDGMRTEIEKTEGITESTSGAESHVVYLSPWQIDQPHRILLHEFSHVLDGQDEAHETNEHIAWTREVLTLLIPKAVSEKELYMKRNV